MPRNDRLAQALLDANSSVVRLAAEVNVDPKTVERWVKGRVPHPQRRKQIAEVLHCSVASLWPEAKSSEVTQKVTVYPSRRAVPSALWRTLVIGTKKTFDLHAFAATFLPDQMDLATELRALADRGVAVRLLLGDPVGDAVRIRSSEEGVAGLAGRVDLVLNYLAPALAHPGIEVRLHDHALYASLYRFDDDLLVNTHIWGAPAAANPVMHLHADEDAVLVNAWMAGFERVWEQAEPLLTWPRVDLLQGRMTGRRRADVA